MDHYNEWIVYNSARAVPTPVVLSVAYCPISSYLCSALNLFLVSNSYLSPVRVFPSWSPPLGHFALTSRSPGAGSGQ